MRIIFLHLSDLHIEKSSDKSFFHIKKVADSLRVLGEFDHILILITGDIAYAGRSEQYKLAWRWISHLIEKLREYYNLKTSPDVLVVPGNHDVNFQYGDLGHATIQMMYRAGQMESNILNECNKMKNFYNFSKGNQCEFEDQLYLQKIIKIGEYTIEANLLNSAPYSTCDEEKGLHYFPQYIFNKLIEPTGADFVITLMHHSYHWFNDKIKNQLENNLLSKSSIIFFGHEHNLGAQNISDSKGHNSIILAGGILSNKGDWTKSEYNASILNMESYVYTQYSFYWDNDENMYSHDLVKEVRLPKKPSYEKRLIPSIDFLASFLEDRKHSISKDFLDYFVFPRLKKEETGENSFSKDTLNLTDFLIDLQKKKKTIISGYENSGKTVFLKQLFKILIESKVVIFCDAENITGNCKRVIKNTFEDIYGTSHADYVRFEQTPIEEKVLIIDDLHRIKFRDFNAFIEEIESSFGYIIYSTNNLLEFDMIQRVRHIVNEDGTYDRYRILPFYTDKMKELIIKIVRILLPDEDAELVSGVLTNVLKRNRRLMSLDPEFIIQYTEYYCKNFKDTPHNDGDLFGKVFEANITNSIAPYCKKIKVDKVFILLDKIAYYIHKNKAYPLKHTDLLSIIDSYNEKYGGDAISPDDFLNITIDSKIIVKGSNREEYKFRNKNQLAYFIAREIRRKYLIEKDDSDLYNILEYSCFGINSDILLFLTYITDNPNMLRDILGACKILTDDWIEYNLDDGNIPYLSNIKPLEVSVVNSKSRAIEEKAEIEQEKLRDSDIIDSLDIYDYKEIDINKLVNQLSRAISLLCVISRSLPNFEHMIEKQDKDWIVDTIYRLPFKIFYLWANEVEKNKEELIEYIKSLPENDYFNEKKPTDAEIIRLLQWDSMTMLLDIMNVGVVYSTKEHTEGYLNSFNYNTSITYSLFHLMVLEERNRIESFYSESKDLFESSKCQMTKTMIKRIVRHLLTHASYISRKDIQRIESVYFPNPLEHKRLLAERQKNNK